MVLNHFKKDQYQMNSMFSWDVSSIEDEEMNEILEKTNTRRVFQNIDSKILESNSFYAFMNRMKNENITVYYLTGEPEWALKENADFLNKAIDKTISWNMNSDNYKIQGMVFDVEPYLLSDWEDNQTALMESLISNLKRAYNYAKENELQIIICIPYWYDKNNMSYLEELIRDCCDEVAVMNYYKNKEYKNMKNEVQLARTYDKDISCIFEFIKPGQHDLSEKNTYYHQGIEAADRVFQQIYNEFNYSKLYCSYHYYTPIKEIVLK